MRLFVPTTVRHQIKEIIEGLGADLNTSDICTKVMYDTDLMGIDSHGISMLAYYHRQVREGYLIPSAVPEVIHDFGAVALVDGKRGFGHAAAHLAMGKAIAKANEFGVGMTVVRDSNHYGAAGYYVRMAAEKGLMGVAMCSTTGALHIPHRSRVAMMGTNPIAFAAPVPGENPILVDMATTTVPLNKVKVYGLKGEELPAEWAADENGNVLTDATDVYRNFENKDAGSFGLLPLGGKSFDGGGHKGSALATMVQILSAAISGADQPGTYHRYHSIGYFFLAIAPKLVNPNADAGEYSRIFRETIRGLAPVDPELPVQATGDRDFETRSRREVNGIPLADALVDQLTELCGSLGVDFVLEETHAS